MDKTNLEPLDPETAVELYLDHKSMNCADSTIRNHRYRMNHFLDWCDETQLQNLNELSGRELQSYRLWLSDKGTLNKLTMRSQLSGLRVFLQWAASVEAVPENLYTKLMIPRIRHSERSSEQILDAEQAKEILEYLSRYQYASSEHVLLAFLWETGMRIGGAYSVDLDDADLDNEHIDLVHRPDQGTRLKNGKSGERLIAISSDLSELLGEYIEANRHNVTGDAGREPLLTTAYGRMTRTTMRRTINRITAPCYIDKPCPDCEQGLDRKCPEAISPHAVRRGSITHYLTEDVPVEVVGDRMDVSRKVLDKHYDKRSREVRLEQRRRFLNDI